MSDSDPLAERVSLALEWLAAEDRSEDEQSRYETAISELEQALAGDVSRFELGQIYEDAASFEQGLSEELDERARERLAMLDRAASRRTKLMIAGIVLGVACATGAVVAVVSFKSHRDTVAASTVVIEQLLAEGRLASAEKYLADLAASALRVVTAPEVVATASKLATLQTEENQRQKAFRAAMDAAVTAADFDHATLQSLALAAVRIEREVKPLATIRRDQTELTALEQRVSEARIEAQKNLDTAFDAQVKALLERQAALEASHDPAPRTVSTEQLQKIQALLGDSSQISDGPVDKLHDLQSLAEKFDKELARREQMARQIGAITAAIGDKQGYSTALASYVQQFPNTPRANGFQQMQQEQSLWQAINDWKQWRGRWGRISWTDLDPEAARDLLKEAETLLANRDVAALPYAAMLRERLRYLTAIAQRGPGNSALVKPLSAFFNNRAISGLRFLQLRDTEGGVKRYYLPDPARRQEQTGKVSFKYVVDFEFKTRTLSTSLESIVSGNTQEGAVDAPAPQALLAQEALTLLSKHSGWEQTFFSILENIEQNKELDPLLKVLMYSQIISVASKGSFCLAKTFAPYREEMEQANLVLTVNWLDPEDAEACARTKQSSQWRENDCPN